MQGAHGVQPFVVMKMGYMTPSDIVDHEQLGSDIWQAWGMVTEITLKFFY
jgi:hypothetical protein